MFHLVYQIQEKRKGFNKIVNENSLKESNEKLLKELIEIEKIISYLKSTQTGSMMEECVSFLTED